MRITIARFSIAVIFFAGLLDLIYLIQLGAHFISNLQITFPFQTQDVFFVLLISLCFLPLLTFVDLDIES